MISGLSNIGPKTGLGHRSAQLNGLQLWKNRALAKALLMLFAAWGGAAQAGTDEHTTFKHIPTQYIAALGDPGATAGTGAQSWGIWRVDPGPRGVWLDHYDQLQEANGIAPTKWTFDSADWWVDENGLLMEKPDFPVPPGKYVVTGDREMMGILTIHPADEDGDRRWALEGATLYDVTHLPCRSARYTPAGGNRACSPANVQKNAFPVAPGGLMPAVDGCRKKDYAVLFVIGVAVENTPPQVSQTKGTRTD